MASCLGRLMSARERLMKRLFIHIGYPKTGSSAIQTVLFASRHALSAAGIFFPKVHAGLCNAVAARFYSRPKSLFPYCDILSDDATIKRQVASDFASIDASLRATDNFTACISSESLIALEPENIRRLNAWALTIAEEVKIICYVRRQTPYAASLIQERVKWGERIPLPADSLPVQRFEHQLPHWELAFGRKNMLVRSASHEELIGNDVVTDFADAIGYKGELDRSTEYRNEGLSHIAVLLLDALNALDNRLVSSDLIFQQLWNLPGEKYQMSADLAQSVEVQAKPHTRYLREHWGIQFADNSNETVPKGMLSKAAAHNLADFIVALHNQRCLSEPSPFRERW